VKLVINIPCYNEEKTLPLVLKRIPKAIEGCNHIETQIVDDGSTDRTVEVAKKYNLRVIRNKHNLGLGKTFRRGINAALKSGADIIVNIDGDGQFDAADIPKLISPILKDEADMVTCTRFRRDSKVKGIPLIKKFGNKIFSRLISRLTQRKFTDTQCGFRAYSREAALRLSLFGNFTYTQEVFLDLVEKGIKIEEVPLRVVYSKKRKSRMVKSTTKYALRSLGIIIRATRDINPLTFFGRPAVITFIIGAMGAMYSVGFWLLNLRTTPIRTLAFVSLFLITLAVLLGVLALIADMQLRMRMTNEEILYRLKKEEFT
jgi:glycosyltransferase involved in cell wall biosynthesis